MKGRVKFTAALVALMLVGAMIALPVFDHGAAYAARTSLTDGAAPAPAVIVEPHGWFSKLLKTIAKIAVCAIWDYYSDLPCPFFVAFKL